MARAPMHTEEVLKNTYIQLYKIVKAAAPDCVTLDQLIEQTGHKASRISKALQWGRRQFGIGKMKGVEYWIMGGPKGYYLPTNEKETSGYIVQNVKDILSRTRTQLPLYDYAMRNFEDTLREAFAIAKAGDPESIRLDMNPWEVFNNIMEEYGYYR